MKTHLTLLLPILLFCALAAGAQTTPKGHLDAGIAKFEAKDWDGAAAAFTRLIEMAPSEPVGYINRGQCLYNVRNYDGAIADLTKAIALDAARANVHYLRGISRLAKKDNDGAVADLTREIELDPRHAKAYYYRAVVSRAKMEYDRAIADLTRVIDLEPRNANAYYVRGQACKDKFNYEAALENVTKAIEIDPKHDYYYAARGRYRWFKDPADLDGATADLEKALEINPATQTGAVGDLCDVRLSNRDYAGSVRACTIAIGQSPAVPRPYIVRGNAHRALGDYNAAIADYTVQIDPEDKSPVADGERAWAYLLAKRYAEAHIDAVSSLARSYVAQLPDTFQVLVGYHALKKGGKSAAATAFLAEWVKKADMSRSENQSLRYLSGQITERQFIDMANTNVELTFAHAFVGLDQSLAGKRAAALVHLDWVERDGELKQHAAVLAETERRRLMAEPAPVPAPKPKTKVKSKK